MWKKKNWIEGSMPELLFANVFMALSRSNKRKWILPKMLHSQRSSSGDTVPAPPLLNRWDMEWQPLLLAEGGKKRDQAWKRGMTAPPDGRQKAKHISKGQRKRKRSSVKNLGLADLGEFGSINALRTPWGWCQFSLKPWSENYSAAVVWVKPVRKR